MGVLTFPELPVRPLQEARQKPIINTLREWGLDEFAELTLLKVDCDLCTQIYQNFDTPTQQSSVAIGNQTYELSFSIADVARALRLPSKGYCNVRAGKQSVVDRHLFPAGESDYNRSESAWKITGMTTSSPVKAIQFLVQYVDLSHQVTYLRNRTTDILAQYELEKSPINWAKHVHQNLLHNRGYGLMIIGNLKRKFLSLRTGHMLMRIVADQIPINVFSAEEGPEPLPLQLFPIGGIGLVEVQRRESTKETGITQERERERTWKREGTRKRERSQKRGRTQKRRKIRFKRISMKSDTDSDSDSDYGDKSVSSEETEVSNMEEEQQQQQQQKHPYGVEIKPHCKSLRSRWNRRKRMRSINTEGNTEALSPHNREIGLLPLEGQIVSPKGSSQPCSNGVKPKLIAIESEANGCCLPPEGQIVPAKRVEPPPLSLETEIVCAENLPEEASEAAEAIAKLQQKMLTLYEDIGQTLKLVSNLSSPADRQSILYMKKEVQRLTTLYLGTQVAKNRVLEEKVKMEEQLSVKEAQISDQLTHITTLTNIVTEQKSALAEATEKIAQGAVYKSMTDARIKALEARIEHLQCSNEELIHEIETQGQMLSRPASSSPKGPATSGSTNAMSDLTHKYDKAKEETDALTKEKEQLEVLLLEERERHRREILELESALLQRKDGDIEERLRMIAECYREAISKLPLPINADNQFEVDFCLLKALYCARFGEWKAYWEQDRFDYMLNALTGDDNKRLRQVLCLALATGRVSVPEESYPILHFPCPKSVISSYLSEILLWLTSETERRLDELKECNIGQIISDPFKRVPEESLIIGDMHAIAMVECMAMQDEGVMSLAPNWNKIDQWASQYENSNSPVNVRSVGKMMLEAHLFWKEAKENGMVIPPGDLGSHYFDSFQFAEPSLVEWNSVRSRLFKKRSKEIFEGRKQ